MPWGDLPSGTSGQVPVKLRCFHWHHGTRDHPIIPQYVLVYNSSGLIGTMYGIFPYIYHKNQPFM